MKKYMTGAVVVLTCLGLGGLLAGFVPGPAPRGPEWRGRLQTSLDASRLPLVDTVRQDSPEQRIRLNRTLEQTTFETEDDAALSLLQLEGWSVSILTEDGPAAVTTPRSLLGAALSRPPAGVVSDEGEQAWMNAVLEVAVLAGEGEPLAPDGRPLRWTNRRPGLAGPVCVVAPVLTLELPRPLLPEPGFHSLSMLARAGRYQETVRRYARKYGLDTSLVLAIMQTESGFNPTLISSRDAHGLMQVVPHTAGDEVHRWLGRSGLPTASELLNPDNNIRYGTAYLHLLRTRHLEGVQDPRSLEYCVIAAYNGGSGAVLRHFGPSREEAFAAINAMSPQDVLNRLTQDFPARETRLFVRKVLASRQQFMARADGGIAAPAHPDVQGASAPARAVFRAPATPPAPSRETVEARQRAQLDAMRRWADDSGHMALASPHG